VTDHHEVPLSLPPAVALIDPKSRDSKYPFFDIAGCTVAFKTCQALYETMFPDRSRNEKLFLIQQYLDLLTLGSVADVVPLVDENRILVKEGLPLLPKTSRLGLSLLLERCGISSSPTATEIAWNVTPVLNAGSRMGKSELSCRLMLSRSREECERLLDEIEKLNGERKSKQTKSYRIINSALAEQNEDSDRIIVVASPDAEVEVAGIIASRVVDQYNRPAVVLVMKGDGITGSARSIESFDIVSALDGCRDLLLKYGGHKAAAGLSLEGAKLEEFRARIKGIAKSGIAEEDLVPKIGIDAKLEFAEVTDGLARDIEKLSPFGTGNPVPVFALYGAVLVRYALIGADSAHLRVKLSNGKSGSCLEGIGWNLGKAGDELIEGGKVDLAFRMEFNAWEGRDYLRLLIEDIRPSG